jgi:hypothetical protein
MSICLSSVCAVCNDVSEIHRRTHSLCMFCHCALFVSVCASMHVCVSVSMTGIQTIDIIMR